MLSKREAIVNKNCSEKSFSYLNRSCTLYTVIRRDHHGKNRSDYMFGQGIVEYHIEFHSKRNAVDIGMFHSDRPDIDFVHIENIFDYRRDKIVKDIRMFQHEMLKRMK